MASIDAASGATKDVRLTARVMVTALATGHVAFHWILQSFVVVLPEIQRTFGLNGVGVGGILTMRELASGLVALPGGVVVDVVRRWWGPLLAVCVGASGLGSLLMGISPAYPLLLLGVAVVAISHSLWHLPAAASLSHHFAERRGTMLAFHGVGGSIGDVAGPLITGALLLVLGWRGILSVYAVAPIFMGFMAVWAFRNIGDVKYEASKELDLAGRVAMTKTLLKSNVLWGLTIVRGLRSMALVALVTLLPLYLGNDLDLGVFNRGFHIGMLIAVGLLAKPAAGYLSDRFGRKQLLVPGLAWSCVMSLALIVFDDGITLTIAIGLLGLFLYPDQPILTAAVFDVVGREVATTGLGVVSFASFLMAATSSLIAGAIYEVAGFEVGLYYIAGLFALAAVIFAVLPLSRRISE
ncbi:MAG TPA: MFS transporter [Dehalococcoidia bacterium]|nr:MFS transporter [Chloroflexota bacterium]MQF96451.1 MFS transporter [SAR202 cluster bacterium]HAA94301.1 MFS transporter [Dehalococcoidia bacterium]HCL24800.1 MFS transporter [Dehalococcoidia bacterium]|tara:strand:- start:2312 stop:3541 length:1230 start_codon:yes stop_codon:yes gene_type:complete